MNDYYGIALFFIHFDAFGWILMQIDRFGMGLIISWTLDIKLPKQAKRIKQAKCHQKNTQPINLMHLDEWLSWNCIGFHSFRCIWMNFDANWWIWNGVDSILDMKRLKRPKRPKRINMVKNSLALKYIYGISV